MVQRRMPNQRRTINIPAPSPDHEDRTPPRPAFISNLERRWHHPRRVAGMYRLSPESQALLDQMPTAVSDDGPKRVQGTDLAGSILAALTRRQHARYGVIDRAVREAGGSSCDRALKRLVESGQVIAEGERGFRVYSLPKKRRR